MDRSNESEDRAKNTSRISSAGGWTILAVAGCGLAAWIAWNALSDRVSGRPATAPGLVSDPPREMDPPVSPGMVNVRVRVRSFDRSGNEDVIGTRLGERAVLKLAGVNGQPYEAQFDRVGMWAMEIPPGEYVVSREQPSLKRWEWTVSGRDVSDEGAEGYRMTFRVGQAPTLELVLR